MGDERTGDEPNRTLPPDPSVPGLWWMALVIAGTVIEWEVWRWNPLGAWIRNDPLRPDQAYAAGWRCIGPAVPPEVPNDAG